MKRAVLRSLLVPALIAAGVSAHAAGGIEKTLVLEITDRPPVVDGVIGAGEYFLTKDLGAVRLSVSRGKDILYLGASAPSEGWVGVGISPGGAMEGAEMFVGFASGARGEMKVQKGVGHFHSDMATQALLSFALKEKDGRTVLEIALRSAPFLSEGRKELVLIAASGTARDFTSPHGSRRSRVVVGLGG